MDKSIKDLISESDSAIVIPKKRHFRLWNWFTKRVVYLVIFVLYTSLMINLIWFILIKGMIIIINYIIQLGIFRFMQFGQTTPIITPLVVGLILIILWHNRRTLKRVCRPINTLLDIVIIEFPRELVRGMIWGEDFLTPAHEVEKKKKEKEVYY